MILHLRCAYLKAPIFAVFLLSWLFVYFHSASFAETFASKAGKGVLQTATHDGPSLIQAPPQLEGTFIYNLPGEPVNLNPFFADPGTSRPVIFKYIFDSLLESDPQTNELTGRLAQRWEISRDQKIFTFYLRSSALFHDGKQVTSEDVKFSFEALLDPQFKAGHLKQHIANINRIEVIDPLTIKFYANNTYFLNLISLGSLPILPKHIYQDALTIEKLNFKFVGSGPYEFKSYDRGQKLSLQRFAKWWGFSLTERPRTYNFQNLIFKFISADDQKIQALKKKEIHFFEMNPETFVVKTEGEPWGKSIFKEQVENLRPKRWSFIGFNFKSESLKDRRVRMALAHSFDREKANAQLRWGQAELVTAPVKNAKPLVFDLKKSSELLAAAGWKDSNKDGVLAFVRSRQKPKLRLLAVCSGAESEKYLNFWKPDLKKIGVDLEIKNFPWDAFLEQLKTGRFDLALMSWGKTGGNFLESDPQQVWHSSSTADQGGSNFIGYNNPKVDELIEKIRFEMDAQIRFDRFQKLYSLINEDTPYLLLFANRFDYYAYTEGVKMPAKTLPYDLGIPYWWKSP